jgi:RNA polymerase sigma-70 factor (ECF subfamily)
VSEIVRQGSAAQAAATAATADVPAVAFGPVRNGEAATFTALVARAQAGDRAAFGLLVERRVDGAFRTARAILGNEADARDASQEAFLRA